ncbi:MAG: DUF1653 domain-containing protein [Nitrospirales bacterium]
MIQPGTYRHYKGHMYQVLGVAKHSETEEDFVVYQSLYGECGWWVRPFEMFCGQVKVGENFVPRFELIERDSGEPR